MVSQSAENQENKSLKNQRVTVIGGNTDGKSLFMEIGVFDGEHTNILKPVFPYDTSAEEITKYMYRLIEDDPKMPDDVVGLMNQTVYWDNEEQSYFSREGNNKPLRHKELKHHDASAPHPLHATHATHKK